MSDDKPKPVPAMNGGKPSGATPYRPSMTKFTGPRADIVSLAPPQEAEPEIGQGIDLTGQAKIIFAAGRGKTGKTTLLRWLTETSIRNGGTPILADVDPSNATFSAYFADVARPETDNPPLPHAVSRQQRKPWCSTNMALSRAQPVSGPLPVSPRRTPMPVWRQIV